MRAKKLAKQARRIRRNPTSAAAATAATTVAMAVVAVLVFATNLNFVEGGNVDYVKELVMNELNIDIQGDLIDDGKGVRINEEGWAITVYGFCAGGLRRQEQGGMTPTARLENWPVSDYLWLSDTDKLEDTFIGLANESGFKCNRKKITLLSFLMEKKKHTHTRAPHEHDHNQQ